jgi:hypothetical protein
MRHTKSDSAKEQLEKPVTELTIIPSEKDRSAESNAYRNAGKRIQINLKAINQ